MPLVYFSVWRFCGFCLVATVTVLSLIPNPLVVPIENGDKFEHLIAYSAMTVWFVWLYASWRRRIVCGFLFAGLGVGLEFLQGLSGQRTFDPFDMLANAAGVSLGLFAAIAGLPNCFMWVERSFLKVVESQRIAG